MKKMVLVLIIFCLYLLGGFSTPITAADFTNGNFESYSGNDFTDWEEYISGEGFIRPDTNITRLDTGTSVNMTVTTATDTCRISQMELTSAGDNSPYTASIWYYDNNPDVYVQLTLSLTSNTENVNNLPATNDSTSWRQLYVTVPCGFTPNDGNIYIYAVPSSGNGSVYIDDAQYYAGTFKELGSVNVVIVSIISFTIFVAVVILKNRSKTIL